MNRFVSVLALVYLGTLPTANATILFSEVMADPNGTDEGREWIEFYAEEETNLSGWRLLEGGVEHRLSLVAGNETVHPGTYFVVADNAVTFVEEYGYNGTLFDSSFSLLNAGELLVFYGANVSVNTTYNATAEGTTWCLLNSTWDECVATAGYDNSPLSQPDNATDTNDSIQSGEVRTSLDVVSYPRSLKFGSGESLGVYVESAAFPVFVYAYGYPKQIVAHRDGKGVRAGDFDGDTSVVVVQNGYATAPLLVKDNCDSAYEDGSYRVRVRLTDEEGNELETEDIELELSGSDGCMEQKPVMYTEEQIVPTENDEPSVHIVETSDNATLGSVLTIKTVIVGTGTFEIYSYLRDDRRIASTGGWTGNRVVLDVIDVGYIELQNTPTKTGNLTLVVRAKAENKTFDAVRPVFVDAILESPPENQTSLEPYEDVDKIVNAAQQNHKQPKKNLWDSFIDMLRGWLG